MINTFRGDYAFLSNYYECPVVFDGLHFLSSEAAFHAQKDKSRECEFVFLSPDDSKHLGRRVNIRPDWDDVKDEIMYKIVKAKFEQNKDLAEKLIATGNEELQEGNWWGDKYWGVYQGEGRNQLGKTLMRVREELR